jgi:hypothetical protein
MAGASLPVRASPQLLVIAKNDNFWLKTCDFAMFYKRASHSFNPQGEHRRFVFSV